jgi:hypothetical protein
MRDFQSGDRVRLRDEPDAVGTVMSYTEEVIGQARDRYLIVRWDGSEARSEPIHEQRFESAT